MNQTDPPAAEAEPICKFEQGCHRVVACDPGCGAAPAVFPEPPSRAAGQDEVDRLAEWLWDNCAEDERSGLLADDPRRIATVALHWPELRRVADEEQPAEAQQQPETEAGPVSLATPCVHCGHPYNWHASRGACEFGNEVNRCGCRAFAPGEKPAPVDPRTILGIAAPVEPAAADSEETRRG